MLRRFFRRLAKALKNAWVVALLISLLVILLIWLVGPLIAIADKTILAGVVARLVATLLVIFGWGLFCAIYYSRKRKKELADPEKAATQEKVNQEKGRLKEEASSIKDKVRAAIKVVTSANFYGPSSRSRYALPWYLVIGTANSGKTSMLLNSGLQFPLNEQADRHLYDLKATEQCEFMYANQAVFIDTPGAYTSALANTEQQKFWNVLLKRLFRARPAKPLNGVIVCVSLRDIMSTDGAKREHLAKTIRARLSDVLKRLHAYVPVYLVLTKCDAVPGFAQFFAHLSRAEREQIFGCPAGEVSMDTGEARTELKGLMQTLNAQIIAKIHQERDLVARGEMFRFPQELAALGARIEDFIFEAFGPSRYHKPTMFRGFFFTSALSVKDVLASASRDGEMGFQSGFQPGMGEYAKGFFLLRLLMDCILPEAKLASSDRESKWPMRVKRHGLQLGAFALFLFATVFLGISFMNNYNNINEINKDYTEVAAIQKERPNLGSSRDALPELDFAVGATEVFNPEEDSQFSYGLGLYQGNKFDRTTHRAYKEILNARLLPTVRADVAQVVAKPNQSLAELKSSLRAYLMLHMPERVNQKFLMDWLQNMWSERYMGDAETQGKLARHMEYLLANGLYAADPNGPLVSDARARLLKIPPAELAYQRMQEEARESGNMPHTFRASFGGKETPFINDNYEIPYLYTKPGFEEYLIRRSPHIIQGLTEDSWIYGPNALTLSAMDVQKLYKEVRAMYFRDYTRYWSEAVSALKVRNTHSLTEASKMAEQFTTGISPVTLVLRDLKTHTNLVVEVPKVANELGDVAGDAAVRQAGRVGGRAGRIVAQAGREAVENAGEGNIADMQKDALTVKQHFAQLVSLLDENSNPTSMLMAAQDEVGKTGGFFLKLATSDNREERTFNALIKIATERDDSLRGLEVAARRLPPPVREWYLTLMYDGLAEMMAMSSRYINKNYTERVVSVFNSDLRPHYPFSRTAERDVNLSDFSAFFKPGGILDTFHSNYLHPFVTQGGELRSIMGRTMPLSKQAVGQLQRAKRVQNAFFSSNGDLSVSFLMEPYSMDATLKRMDIIHGDKTLTYWHGPVQGVNISWPLEHGSSAQASINTTNLQNFPSTATARGDWALFRIFEKGTIRRQNGNTCLIRLLQNNKWIDVQIQFRNRSNPLDPSICSFVFPAKLL